MKHRIRVFLLIVCVALWLVCLSTVVYAEGASTELVVLFTTDMHGKCWETNLLTGGKVTQNMLRVSTAVQQIRDAYGRGQVILIDNGDLFQGTPISEEHLLCLERPGDEPAPMALCLKEIGYDCMVLGNHEFNYPWAMKECMTPKQATSTELTTALQTIIRATGTRASRTICTPKPSAATFRNKPPR